MFLYGLAGLIAGLFCLLAAAASPLPASAAVFTGKISDPAGDGPEPARDLVSAAATYDPSNGKFKFTLETAGPPAPSESSQYIGTIGRFVAPGVCGAPSLTLGTSLPGGSTIWLRDNDGLPPAEFNGQATRKIKGNRLTLSAVDPDMAGLDATCGLALISDAATGETLFDDTAVFPVRELKKPRLAVKLLKMPGKIRRGVGLKAKVRITNRGNAKAKFAKLKIEVKGRAAVRPKLKKLGNLGPGGSRTVPLKLKSSRRSKGTIRVTVRANAVNAKPVTAAKQVKVKAPRKRTPGTKRPGDKGSLAGKLFWGFEAGAYDHSADVFGLHFVNRRFVHLGMPEGGLVNCRKVTAKVKKGRVSSGCVRYSYNGRSGKVRIGGSRGTFRKGKLKLKMKGREGNWGIIAKTWFGSSLPRPGARFDVKLRSTGFRGLCGVTPYCSTWSENLILKRNGQFGRQKSSLSTGGGNGPPFVAIGNLGPDERGRYKVLSRSRIQFRYANGKRKTQTVAVQLNKRGRPDPAREGLLIDDDWFFRP